MPAHYLRQLDLQQQVDYVNTCQARVSADTLALEKTTTIAVSAGEHTAALPDDLVELRAVFNGAVPLEELTADELLAALSGIGPEGYAGLLSYAVVGRTLYVLPQQTDELTLTVTYAYRAPAFASDSDLVLTGDERELLEDLLDAYVTFDRGETEVGADGLTRYLLDARRLRAANKTRAGSVDRRPVIDHDRFL